MFTLIVLFALRSHIGSTVTKKQNYFAGQETRKTRVLEMPGRGRKWPARVDGTTINDHGDAHGDDEFCNSVRQARVQGHVEAERFVVKSFSLLSVETK